MRLLLLSPELFLADGGIARIMRLYLKALCEICGPDGEVRSVVLNDRTGPEPNLAGYANERLREHSGCQRDKVRYTWHTIRLGRAADRLICGHLHQLPAALLARVFNPRLRYYLVAHGIEVWRPYTRLEKMALRHAHRIICISEYTRRQMLRFYPDLDPARLLVVPNTLDPNLAPEPVPTPAGAMRAPGPVILTVGRLAASDKYKGYDTLIEAMPLVLEDFPQATLRIVGNGDDVERLRALAAQHGVAASVVFTGTISDEALRAEYAACDLFALLSRKEGFGLVFLEAMIHGKPCLGAQAGGVREVINDEVGALAAYGNIPGIAAAISDLVAYPRDPAVIKAHAATFAFPAFRQRLAQALAS